MHFLDLDPDLHITSMVWVNEVQYENSVSFLVIADKTQVLNIFGFLELQAVGSIRYLTNCSNTGADKRMDCNQWNVQRNDAGC